MNLVAHLGADSGSPGGFTQGAGLADGVRERLLEVDVLAQLEGPQGGQGVHVVGGGDHDGVEAVAEPGEHLPVVGEVGGAGAGGVGRAEALAVDVAEGDLADLRVRSDLPDVIRALAAAADVRDLQAGVEVASAHHGREGERGEGGRLEEASAGERHGFRGEWWRRVLWIRRVRPSLIAGGQHRGRGQRKRV